MAAGLTPAGTDSPINLSRLSLRTPDLTSHQTDLSRWPIFSILPEDVLNSIRKICVFGSSGNEAIFITASDDVCAIGSNCSSCLGLGTVDGFAASDLLDIYLIVTGSVICLLIWLFVCWFVYLFFVL